MYLKDIIANDYKIFERMGDDNKKANISAVQYVHMLSATTNAKADTWNILEIFGRGEGNSLVTDKNEINKRFFGHLEYVRSALPEELLELEPEIERQIKEATRDLVNAQTRQFRDKAESARYTMNDHYLAAERKAAEMTKYMNMLLAVQGKSNPILDEIKKVAASSYWKFVSYDQRIIQFSTRNPVVLTHKNPSAGIDITLNMGSFGVRVDLKTMYATVYGAGDNIDVQGFKHPHVSTRGDICWGTGSTAASHMQKDFKIYDLLELLASNLSNYNADNPYISLERFKVQQEESKGKKVEYCPDCTMTQDQCDCSDEPEEPSYCSECELNEEDCACQPF